MVKKGEVVFMNRMKELREERNITQEELAFALDISQQRISKIERNRAPMTERLIISCAQYFGVTTDYFLGVSDYRIEIELEEIENPQINEGRIREFLQCFSRMGTNEQEAVIEIEKILYRMSNQQ